MSHNVPQNPSLGRGASGTWPCSATRASPPALAVFSTCGALWCVLSARAIATLIRAYRRYARRRRSLRRRALPVPPPASSRSTSIINRQSFTQEGYNTATLGWKRLVVVVVVVVVVVQAMCSAHVSVDMNARDAPNYGGRVPVDTTPDPAPVCRALKNPTSNSSRR